MVPSESWGRFGTCVNVNSGHLVSRPLTLKLTLKVKYTSSSHGCLRCPGSLATAWYDFGSGADGTLAGIPSFDLGCSLECQMKGQHADQIEEKGRQTELEDPSRNQMEVQEEG